MTNGYNLKDRILSCVSGSFMGSLLGVLTRGMTPGDIAGKYGLLDEDDPCRALIDAWRHAPVTATDLMERTKLLAQAVIDREDRIRAEDVWSVWRNKLNEEQAKGILQPYEVSLLALAQANIPASDIGRYSDYSGLNNFACSCLPIGLINACDPEHAKDDAEDVGRLYQAAGSSGVKWAAAAAVAVASALKPQATVKSVLEDIFRLSDSDAVRKEIEKGLGVASKCKTFKELTDAFDSMYNADGIPYAISFAKETVTKALCIFQFVNGSVEKAAIFGAGTGRDAGSTAALAAGITGAMGRGSAIPEEWINLADKAETANKNTFNHFTINELSDQIHYALMVRIQKLQKYSRIFLND